MKIREYTDHTDLGRTKAVCLKLNCPHCESEATLVVDKNIGMYYGQCIGHQHKFTVVFNYPED